jgi:hypothetical protein
MPGIRRWLATESVMLAAVLTVAGCGSAPAAATATAAEPVKIEAIGDTGVKRLTLTDKAVERLAITTAPVTEDLTANGAATGRLLIPYSALLYLPDGTTIAYTNPEGRAYVREMLTVESIRGDQAVLTAGPPVGTAVVTAGAAELWGSEFGIK